MSPIVAVQAACTLASQTGVGGASGNAALDEPTAYVSFNMPPDGDCLTSSDGDIFLSKGTYDISPGLAPDGADNCANSYFINLKVEGAPPTTRFNQARVRLMTVDGETLDFGQMLPNPFNAVVAATVESTAQDGTTVAVVAFEALPDVYAAFLGALVGATIILEIDLSGSTSDDADVNVRYFQFPLEICDGCLTMCLYDDILNRMLTPDDVLDGKCDDVSLSGQDGRVCIDPDC